MPEETLLTLLDSYWYEYTVFKSKRSLKATSILDSVHEQEKIEPNLNPITTFLKKSHSELFLSSKSDTSTSDSSSSPKSVLLPQLQTILSGKEVDNSSPDLSPPKKLQITIQKRKQIQERRQKKSSRSMSELEFDELKGFMDLGFVFSDEAKDSALISIVPGLQRLGKNDIVEELEQQLSISRPYLSEAWDCMENEEKKKPLRNWIIPNYGNEMELKNHLKFWAHSVASAVR